MNNYGQRLRTFVVPPTNGAYTFWIASDDASQLSLSSNESPSNEVAMAWVNAWTDRGNGRKSQIRSRAAIYLEGGRRYYLEAIMGRARAGIISRCAGSCRRAVSRSR